MFKYVHLKQMGAVRGQNISRVISAQECGINIYCNRIKERSLRADTKCSNWQWKGNISLMNRDT